MSSLSLSCPNVVSGGAEASSSVEVERLPEPLIRLCHTTYLVQGSSWLYPPIPVMSIR